MTKVKKAILDIVMHSSQHLSADQIYRKAKSQIPSVALGTVYRNLNQLADLGQIRRVGQADSPDFFEGNISPHDHVLCSRCGEISDIVVPGLKDFLTTQINCDILSFDLTVHYLCPKCKEKDD